MTEFVQSRFKEYWQFLYRNRDKLIRPNEPYALEAQALAWAWRDAHYAGDPGCPCCAVRSERDS